MIVEDIQSAVRGSAVDGWLFYDYQNRDPLALRILGLSPRPGGRRWFYFVPGKDQPVKLVHFDESTRLDGLPGETVLYRSWNGMQRKLKEILGDYRKVAMQYSPFGRLPVISNVDAGTLEMVRNCGVEVLSSADLVQRFEGVVNARGYESHVEAGRRLHVVLDTLWAELREAVRASRSLTERDLQQRAQRLMREANLTADGEAPVVAAGENTVDWRYRTRESEARVLGPGDALLVDLWARLDQPGAIYHSTCWTGFVGSEPTDDYLRLFRVVTGARDAALAFLRERLAAGGEVRGWEVDKVCRGYVEAAGLGEQFVHPTGHSLGHALRSAGVAIDSLETQDDRLILPGSLFSVAPGVYAPEHGVGVRCALNVYVDAERQALVAGPVQERPILLP